MKKIFYFLTTLSLILILSTGCGKTEPHPVNLSSNDTPVSAETDSPKYVFLFIGDGMSYPQFQVTSDYLGALEDEDYFQAAPSLDDNQGAILDGPSRLNFMNFPVTGTIVNYDSNSFAPDSSSSATSIATGHKTYSSYLNVDETGTIAYETIAEKLRDQTEMKIGIISSANLNHATPAAFYAHQPNRNNYYEIGLEMISSDFDFFAGGVPRFTTGYDRAQRDLFELAAEAGYQIVRTQAEAEAVTSTPVIMTTEYPADSDAMVYEIDRKESMWSLADYVKKGIELLDNDHGFFLMCEGGKIDWAGHANDAATVISDTIAFADAVQSAIDFAKEHEEETLILVTGDHETGGLTIGYALTQYDTYLTLLSHQKISFQKFDSKYIAKYKKEQTAFSDVLKDIKKLFGLKQKGKAKDKMVLTEDELALLEQAYAYSILGEPTGMTPEDQYLAYGSYEPLSVTITHILANKSGLSFSSYSHTGLPVAIFADGVGAESFDGYYDNTEIFTKLAALLEVQ